MRLPLKHIATMNPRHAALKHRTRRLSAIRPSHANELWYRKRLLTIVEAVITAVQQSHLLEMVKPLAIVTDTRTLGLDATLTATMLNMLQRLITAAGGLTHQAATLAGIAARQNLKGVDERLIAAIQKSINVNVAGLLTESPMLRTIMNQAIRDNVELIQSIPIQHLDRVRDIIAENLAQGFRWESLVDEIAEAGEATRNRAKIIARDQTSKMNSAFNEVRQQSLGIERYEWQSSGDERVRESHAEKDGNIYRWDDPPEDTGHPGQDILCRCTAIPIVELEGAE